MNRVLLILLLSTTITPAQKFYPLEIGNSWKFVKSYYYEEGKDTIPYVIEDTIHVNGNVYYTFNRGDITGLNHVRSDSNSIYYYNIEKNVEAKVFDFTLNIDEWIQLPVEAELMPYFNSQVQLGRIDTVEYFGEEVPVYVFFIQSIGGVEIHISEKYGPVYRADHEELGVMGYYTFNIHSVEINGNKFITSINMHMNNTEIKDMNALSINKNSIYLITKDALHFINGARASNSKSPRRQRIYMK